MTTDQAILFTLLIVVFALLIWGRLRYDLVAFSALVCALVLHRLRQPAELGLHPLLLGAEPRVLLGIVRADGTFIVDGLSPGLWRLSGSPRALGVTEIHVDAHQAVVTVELDAARE